MKRFLLYALMLLSTSMASAQGIPFIKNYTADDYLANRRNFDVKIGSDGTVYVANFEGLMYYDKAEWRILHNPGITRITVVFQASNGTMYVGGYNYLGKVIHKDNGELALQQVGVPHQFRGEVLEIYEKAGDLLFIVNDGNLYKVKGNQIVFERLVDKSLSANGLSDVVNPAAIDNHKESLVLRDVSQEIELENGQKVQVRVGEGIAVTDASGRQLYQLNEDNGLCNNNVVWIDHDKHGTLWGVTDNGVFAVALPSVYSHFTPHEGLTGEVRAIDVFKGTKYVGTSTGLFRQVGRRMEKVPGINHACWCMVSTDNALYAGTASGTFRVSAGGSVSQLTTTGATSIMLHDGLLYIGEQNGLFTMAEDGSNRHLVSKVVLTQNLKTDANGVVWAQNLYGEVWCCKDIQSGFRPYTIGVIEDQALTLVPLGDSISVVNIQATTPFPYPQFSYIDKSGVTWLTDNEGKNLYRWKGGSRLDDMQELLYPFSDNPVRALYSDEDEVWIGTDEGVTVIMTNQSDPLQTTKPQMLFRSVTLGDSVLWGGYGVMPEELPKLASNLRNLTFTYSLNYVPVVGKTLYRYRLNDDAWSQWDDETEVEYLNLAYGSYTIYVQARLANGQLSEIASLDFSIAYPFYMRWYMGILYLLLVGLLVMLFFRYRLHRLNLEKQKLERIVQERTADLRNAQHELIRQEKMATVGKLTQGLIDRILNPLNYINNFSKLSEGLVKDVEANVEDEKDHIDQENYDDTMDVLSMLRGNLQKVSEHGQNTTRTLKAMEEMLKDRSGGIVPMDLVTVLRQDEEMLRTYYAADIKDNGIRIVFDIAAPSLRINGNADQLSKTLMSLLGNSVYAVVRKAQKSHYTPEVALRASAAGNKVIITIRDNGIGIEDTIIDKIFDPFFTTKTTSEAAGVGLYLSREIVQNHGGDIQVESVKNEYSEFTITLPALKA